MLRTSEVLLEVLVWKHPPVFRYLGSGVISLSLFYDSSIVYVCGSLSGCWVVCLFSCFVVWLTVALRLVFGCRCFFFVVSCLFLAA